MFGFLAFLGPVGIGAAIIGTAATAAYVYMKDDEKSSSGTNATDSKHREEKNTTINSEIESYKENQKNRFKNNYSVDIKFVTKTHSSPDFFVSSGYTAHINTNTSSNEDKIVVQGVYSKFESMANLKNEITELEDLINLLKLEKTEVINETI